MTKIKNSKQLAFDLIWDLDIVIWNLFGPILRSGGACNLLFPVYPGLGNKSISQKLGREVAEKRDEFQNNLSWIVLVIVR